MYFNVSLSMISLIVVVVVVVVVLVVGVVVVGVVVVSVVLLLVFLLPGVVGVVIVDFSDLSLASSSSWIRLSLLI